MKTYTEKPVQIRQFKDLIQPLKIDDFKNIYWENEVLHLKREEKKFYSSLFSVKAFDKLLNYNRPRGTSLKVVKSQVPMNPTIYENQDGSLNLNQLYAAYADGHTIVVNEIQRFWDPIKLLVENIRNEISHHVVANLYLTPANEKALSPHYDTHDVFALQISGEKRWILYDDTHFKTPLLNSFQPIFQREHLSGGKEVVMKPGDLMYIPRGVPHEAYTTDNSSMHITLGVHSTQWIDFITKSILNLSQQHIELRRALPLKYLSNPESELLSSDAKLDFINLLQKVFEKDNMEGALNILSEEMRTKDQPTPDGHFSSLDKLHEIALDTSIEKRDGLTSKVTNNVTGSRILFQGNVIKGPSQLANTLEFISQQNEEFAVGEIPFLSDSNKITLAKRLIRGGLLKIVS